MTTSNKPWSVLIPVLLLAVLLGVCLLNGGDYWLFIQGNRLAQSLPPTFWQILSTLADPLAAPLIVFALFYKQPLFLRALLIGAIMALTVSFGLKYGFGLPRPTDVLAAHEFVKSGPDMQSPSFPSGHTITIFLLMSLISHWFGNMHLTVSLFVIALGISLSRIAVGAHWPSDILLGALLGWAIGWVAIQINQQISQRLGDTLSEKWLLSIYFTGLLTGIYALITKTPYPDGQWLSTAAALFAIAYGLRSITECLHQQKG
ncbi:MAG: hypothetical protein CSB47_01715 [Proteobacteria bacterium]|nr:MAG: hypothetical protein CSB47_01715 [Pseudomonadota bacterium]